MKSFFPRAQHNINVKGSSGSSLGASYARNTACATIAAPPQKTKFRLGQTPDNVIIVKPGGDVNSNFAFFRHKSTSTTALVSVWPPVVAPSPKLTHLAASAPLRPKSPASPKSTHLAASAPLEQPSPASPTFLAAPAQPSPAPPSTPCHYRQH